MKTKNPITEQIKNFSDACKIKKIDPNKLPDVSMLPKIHRKSIIAFYMLTIIIEALNEGWKPTWNDHNEYKYYNYFYIESNKSSGFRFSYSYCRYTDTFSYVGSPLCFKTRELAEYAKDKFKRLYEDYLLI